MCVRRQEEERRGEKRNIGQCVLGGRKRRGEKHGTGRMRIQSIVAKIKIMMSRIDLKISYS